MKFILGNLIIDLQLKKIILQKAYSLINFFNYKFKILNNKEIAEKESKNIEYITTQINSVNYIMFFIYFNNTKYNILINREKLKVSLDRIDINEVIIYNFIIYNFYISDSFYNGTIFDGKLSTYKNYNMFMIIDIYYINGNNLLNIDMLEKIEKTNKIIENYDINLPKIKKKEFLDHINEKINVTGLEDNINLDNGTFNDFLSQQKKTSNKIYDIQCCKYILKHKLKDLIYDEIKNNEININGLVFMPKKSGIYFIYSNKNEFNKLKNNSNNNLESSIYKSNDLKDQNSIQYNMIN